MGLVLTTVLLAAGAGRLAGGRLRSLQRLPYRGLALLWGAVAALGAGLSLVLAGVPARAAAGGGLAVAAGLVAAFCVRSRAVPGLGLLGAGLLLNAAVGLGNGGMPVSAYAAARAGVDPAAATADERHLPAGAGTVLPWLGDVIPVPLPVRPEVVSAGDVLGAAGLGQLVLTAMLAGRRAGTGGGSAGRASRRGTRRAWSPRPPSATVL
jgi:Family of unknown function (DUF5317)